MKTLFLQITVFILLTLTGMAQGTRSDYQRALGMRETTAGKVFRQRVKAHWIDDHSKFWYRNTLPGDQSEVILVDVTTGKRVPADIEAVAGGSIEPDYRERPSRRGGEETMITFVNETGDDLEVYWIDTAGKRKHYTALEPGGEFRQHTYAGHVWLLMNKSDEKSVIYAATEVPERIVVEKAILRRLETRQKAGGNRGKSPDGQWTGYIESHNLFIKNDSGAIPLTGDGLAEDGYRGRIHWSPDSKKLVVMRVRKGDDRKVHVVESAPEDQLQPRLHTFSYLKPGDQIDRSMPCLFDVEGKRRIPIPDALFPNPWNISRVHWMPDSSRFLFQYNQRGHQVMRIISVDAGTGRARAVVDEQSETFIDYAGKHFSAYLDDTGEIIWMSERDGWNHLYLYDAIKGVVKNRITEGSWVVRRVEHVDAENRVIWFFAGGIRPEQDPYYQHLCRVNFDGSGFTVLTEGDGTHSIDFSPDRKYFVDRWSRVDLPPVSELRRAEDGKLVCELEKADWNALLETGWKPSERFVAKGRDGSTDIHGIIIRPSRFDPKRSYPVIEEIYAGPHGSFVPKAFGLQTRQHAIAELGFIVVQIDGMGTSHRSKAFHDVCWKNLGDSGFPDRILWMKAAAEKYPYMDLSRVGIYGGSAGGQSALRALLAYPDFYKVGVADCGCHDNRMDKIWWNELWMGWPIGPHYEEQSNVTQAHRLQGKLLLTVGEIDKNVDPASTMQVVDALIKADKDFDLIVMPGQGHGAGETPYASRRRMIFFTRHLLGKELPSVAP
jgi:dipeptidyl aminopeptidase/acylaminoacyl peptidase